MMVIKHGGDGKSRGVIVFHVGNTRFNDVTNFPKTGAFVHVFVEPFFANGEVKFLNNTYELRVKGLERREDVLEEIDGHEVVGVKGSKEIVEALG